MPVVLAVPLVPVVPLVPAVPVMLVVPAMPAVPLVPAVPVMPAVPVSAGKGTAPPPARHPPPPPPETRGGADPPVPSRAAAALYGLGVYFAARAAVAARERYSPPSADGSKYVFVAKVLTGRYAAGGRGLRAPPLREGEGEGAGAPPRRYDSVVDDPRRPRVFVIFNDTQAYPQYLLTCRRRGGPP